MFQTIQIGSNTILNTLFFKYFQANEMASAGLSEQGNCLKSNEKPRLLKATPLNGSEESVRTLNKNGLA